MLKVIIGKEFFELSVHPDVTIEELLCSIVKLKPIDLIYGRLIINDSKYVAVGESDMQEKVCDLKIYKLTYRGSMGGGPRACHWTDYIRSSSIIPFEKNVRWQPTIEIYFKSFKSYASPHYSITPSKLNVPLNPTQFQNNWSRYWSNHYDKNYKWFTGLINRSLVMLVELENVDNVFQIRYDVFGCNDSYYGGEYASWQRYTKELPIPFVFSWDQESILIIPKQPLRPNRWHAVLLLNTPICGIDRVVPAIYDDHIIPFLPNDVSRCRDACLAFILGTKKGTYLRMHAIIICRYYVWPSRFGDEWNRTPQKRIKMS